MIKILFFLLNLPSTMYVYITGPVSSMSIVSLVTWCIMSSSNEVSYVHNGSLKYGMNSSSNMNILKPMHIVCLQKYLVQTTNRQLTLFLFKRVNLSTSQAKCTKEMHSLLYIELKPWFLQYLIVIRLKWLSVFSLESKSLHLINQITK